MPHFILTIWAAPLVRRNIYTEAFQAGVLFEEYDFGMLHVSPDCGHQCYQTLIDVNVPSYGRSMLRSTSSETKTNLGEYIERQDKAVVDHANKTTE